LTERKRFKGQFNVNDWEVVYFKERFTVNASGNIHVVVRTTEAFVGSRYVMAELTVLHTKTTITRTLINVWCHK